MFSFQPRSAASAKAIVPAAERSGPVRPESDASSIKAACRDKLCYHHGGVSLPVDKPHAFVYFITIRNGSDRAVTLLGRKWVVLHTDGTQLVIEGDKIVGETPRLAPGEQFSYNSYHVTGVDANAHGSFHGVDELGNKIHVLLPPFEMTIPRS